MLYKIRFGNWCVLEIWVFMDLEMGSSEEKVVAVIMVGGPTKGMAFMFKEIGRASCRERV